MAESDRSGPGVVLRPVTPEDHEFLRRVHASTVEPELESLGWDQPRRAPFLGMHYELQSRTFETTYPGADRYVILAADQPVGRLYVNRGESEIRVVEISLLPERRGSGIGTRLLEEILEEARSRGVPVRLQVEKKSRALGWSQRIGFQRVRDRRLYWEMEHRP